MRDIIEYGIQANFSGVLLKNPYSIMPSTGGCGQQVLLESGAQVRSLRDVGGLGVGGLAGVASGVASAFAVCWSRVMTSLRSIGWGNDPEIGPEARLPRILIVAF